MSNDNAGSGPSATRAGDWAGWPRAVTRPRPPGPARTMASPSPSGGATTSPPPNATGSGSSRCIGAAWGEAASAHGVRNRVVLVTAPPVAGRATGNRAADGAWRHRSTTVIAAVVEWSRPFYDASNAGHRCERPDLSALRRELLAPLRSPGRRHRAGRRAGDLQAVPVRHELVPAAFRRESAAIRPVSRPACSIPRAARGG